MKPLYLTLALFCATAASAETFQADFRAYSKSLALNPTTTLNRVGNVTYQLYFSSIFPGHLPLYVPGADGTVIVSSELRRVPGSTAYVADFGLWSGPYIVQDGRIRLTLPGGDRDGNGIPDLIERDKTFYTGIKGKSFVLWPATNTLSLEGVFSRAGGQHLGAYSGIMRGTGANFYFNGNLGLVSIEGSILYTRGVTNTMYMELVRTDQAGNQTFLTGSTTYRATRNAVQLPRIVLSDGDGMEYVIRPATLLRKKDRYVGSLVFVDGALETPWQDFKNWSVEIIDRNDSDANRIPDFSDPSALPGAF